MTDDDFGEEANAEFHAELLQRRLAILLEGRPPQFAVPGGLDTRLAQWAAALAAGKPQNLILTGGVGCGKTWSVWHAAEWAVRAGYTGRVTVTTAGRLHDILAPSSANPAEHAGYIAADLLVLDDLGSFRLSPWDLDHLGEIIDQRWAWQRPTVITSNETSLRPLLGERIASRIQDGALIVAMDGDDRRRQS
jgi:DNA replication protein DnaC